MRPLAKLMRALLAYPDSCIHGERIPLALVQEDGSVEMEMLVDVPPLSADVIYPKEQALIDLVDQGTRAGPEATRLRVSHRHA